MPRRKKPYHPEPNRPSQLVFRIGKDEQDALRAAAALAGLPLGEWVRRELFRAAGLPLEQAHRKQGWPPGKPRPWQRRKVDGAAPDAADGPDGTASLPSDSQASAGLPRPGAQGRAGAASNGGAAGRAAPLAIVRNRPVDASGARGGPSDGPERPDAA